ncbi:MAG TPA: radical SAM protein, partial [Clostridiales bacterium]|nr:radical SAM protein [Clostridiales bacterium]
STIKGLTFRRENEVINNPDADYITELDEIPFAAPFIKEYLGVQDYFFVAAAHPSIQLFTGRGCPARCNFCVYPQTMHGHKYRLRSVDNVVAEFEYIVNSMPEVKEIVIEDDTFTVNKQRTVEICNRLIEKGLNKKIRWLCNARVNLDLETMKLMKKAGCHLIIPGVESLNQTILNNIKKGTTVEQIKKYMANARKARLMVHACYMVGNNGETRETMEETLRAAMKFKTDTAQFFPLIPYPGTEAYDWAKSKGYINGKYDEYCQEDGTLNCIINTPALKASELVDFCAYARKKYYLRPWYILHRIYRGLGDFEDLKRSLKAFGRLKQTLFKKI